MSIIFARHLLFFSAYGGTPYIKRCGLYVYLGDRHLCLFLMAHGA